MLYARSWTAPPTRREVTLLLFSFTIFVLSYNLETSLSLVGVHPQKLKSTYLSSIGAYLLLLLFRIVFSSAGLDRSLTDISTSH